MSETREKIKEIEIVEHKTKLMGAEVRSYELRISGNTVMLDTQKQAITNMVGAIESLIAEREKMAMDLLVEQSHHLAYQKDIKHWSDIKLIMEQAKKKVTKEVPNE